MHGGCAFVRRHMCVWGGWMRDGVGVPHRQLESKQTESDPWTGLITAAATKLVSAGRRTAGACGCVHHDVGC